MSKVVTRRRLFALLIQGSLLPIGVADAEIPPFPGQSGETQMTEQDGKYDKDESGKRQPSPVSKDMVNTPAGRVPKGQVHEVKPGEAIRRDKDGALVKIPPKN